MEENCYLEYPSVVCLSKNLRVKEKRTINIGSGTKVEGIILAYEKEYQKHPPHVGLEKGTKVVGEIFVKGSVDLRGELEGSLSCKSFQVRTKTATYDNYILDGKINRTLLSKEYVSPLVDGSNTWKIVKYIR